MRVARQMRQQDEGPSLVGAPALCQGQWGSGTESTAACWNLGSLSFFSFLDGLCRACLLICAHLGGLDHLLLPCTTQRGSLWLEGPGEVLVLSLCFAGQKTESRQLGTEQASYRAWPWTNVSCFLCAIPQRATLLSCCLGWIQPLKLENFVCFGFY